MKMKVVNVLFETVSIVSLTALIIKYGITAYSLGVISSMSAMLFVIFKDFESLSTEIETEKMTIKELKGKYYPEYQYIVIDTKRDDIFLCKTYEDARKKRISLITHGKLSVCIKNLGEL